MNIQHCKRILGAKTATNNLLVYSGFGRSPLYIQCYIRIIKCWLTLYDKNKKIVCLNTSSINESNTGDIEGGRK